MKFNVDSNQTVTGIDFINNKVVPKLIQKMEIKNIQELLRMEF